jgi:hypothetical protein
VHSSWEEFELTTIVMIGIDCTHKQDKYRNAHLVFRTTEQIKYRDVLNLYWNIWYLSKLWKDSRDRMVVRFTTTGAINAYHYYSCEFELF